MLQTFFPRGSLLLKSKPNLGLTHHRKKCTKAPLIDGVRCVHQTQSSSQPHDLTLRVKTGLMTQDLEEDEPQR